MKPFEDRLVSNLNIEECYFLYLFSQNITRNYYQDVDTTSYCVFSVLTKVFKVIGGNDSLAVLQFYNNGENKPLIYKKARNDFNFESCELLGTGKKLPVRRNEKGKKYVQWQVHSRDSFFIVPEAHPLSLI